MNYLETIGTAVGLAYLWLEYRASIWLWLGRHRHAGHLHLRLLQFGILCRHGRQRLLPRCRHIRLVHVEKTGRFRRRGSHREDAPPPRRAARVPYGRSVRHDSRRAGALHRQHSALRRQFYHGAEHYRPVDALAQICGAVARVDSGRYRLRRSVLLQGALPHPEFSIPCMPSRQWRVTSNG